LGGGGGGGGGGGEGGGGFFFSFYRAGGFVVDQVAQAQAGNALRTCDHRLLAQLKTMRSRGRPVCEIEAGRTSSATRRNTGPWGPHIRHDHRGPARASGAPSPSVLRGRGRGEGVQNRSSTIMFSARDINSPHPRPLSPGEVPGQRGEERKSAERPPSLRFIASLARWRFGKLCHRAGPDSNFLLGRLLKLANIMVSCMSGGSLPRSPRVASLPGPPFAEKRISLPWDRDLSAAAGMPAEPPFASSNAMRAGRPEKCLAHREAVDGGPILQTRVDRKGYGLPPDIAGVGQFEESRHLAGAGDARQLPGRVARGKQNKPRAKSGRPIGAPAA